MCRGRSPSWLTRDWPRRVETRRTNRTNEFSVNSSIDLKKKTKHTRSRPECVTSTVCSSTFFIKYSLIFPYVHISIGSSLIVIGVRGERPRDGTGNLEAPFYPLGAEIRQSKKQSTQSRIRKNTFRFRYIHYISSRELNVACSVKR